MNKLLTTFLSLFISITVFAGTNDTLKIEIPSKYTEIHTLDNCLLVSYPKDRKQNKNKIIERYDSNFNVVKRIEFVLDDKDLGWAPSRKYQFKDKYYFLYYYKKVCQVLTYDLKTNEIHKSPVISSLKLSDPEFIVLNENAYVAFNSLGAMHYKPNFFIFNIKTGKTNITELTSKTRTTYPIKSLSYNKSLNEVNLVFQSSLDEGSELEILRFDSTGKQIKPLLLIKEPTSEYHPTSIKISPLDKNDFIISGLSLLKPQKGVPVLTIENFKKEKEYHLFISNYEKNKMTWVKYLNYSELKSIKDFYKKDDQIFFSNPIFINSDIYFIGEVYHPVYTQKLVSDYSITSNSSGLKSQAVLDYYQFTNTLILCIDKENGELKWDKTISTFVDSRKLNSKYKLSTSESQLSLIIQNDNYIKQVDFDSDGNISNKNLFKLSNKKQKQNVQLFENWYNDKMIEIVKTNYKDSKIEDKYTIRKF